MKKWSTDGFNRVQTRLIDGISHNTIRIMGYTNNGLADGFLIGPPTDVVPEDGF